MSSPLGFGSNNAGAFGSTNNTGGGLFGNNNNNNTGGFASAAGKSSLDNLRHTTILCYIFPPCISIDYH